MARSDKWEVYKDKKGEWRWRRTSSNGQIIGAATEGYVRKIDCVKNAERNGLDPDTPFGKKDKWELYQDKKGEYRWRRFASNGKLVGAATEGYVRRADATKNMKKHNYPG